MLAQINITGFAREPRDRSPEVDADDLSAFRAYAGSLRYAHACEIYNHLRHATPMRPHDLANSPVLHAWMAVLAIEASLLEYARARALGENAAYRFFVSLRGDGIPRKPAWRMDVGAVRAEG